MKPSLKVIGYWGGFPVFFWPHPRELVCPNWDPGLKSKIVDYLRQGVRINEYLGYSHCRFPDGPPDDEMGNAEQTDGVWVWPEALSMYVSRYNVLVPDAFLAHAAANDFRIPKELNEEELEDRPGSFREWQDWSDLHRSNRLLAHLSRLTRRWNPTLSQDELAPNQQS